MQTLTQQLKNLSVNNSVPLDRALKVGDHIDQEREETIALLKRLERQVGMTDGEAINKHIAAMTGGYFNERDYHFERLPGEQ